MGTPATTGFYLFWSASSVDMAAYGGEGNDTLISKTGGETLHGEGGDDTLVVYRRQSFADQSGDVQGGSGFGISVSSVTVTSAL